MQLRMDFHRLLERLSYDLEKVFAICFTDQCLARLKQSFSLFPPRKLLIWAVNSSIAQSYYCISNDVKAKLSRKFHGEMTLFATVFAKPMKIRARLFFFDKPIKCFAFLFTFSFQGHMKVALVLFLLFLICLAINSLSAIRISYLTSRLKFL